MKNFKLYKVSCNKQVKSCFLLTNKQVNLDNSKPFTGDGVVLDDNLKEFFYKKFLWTDFICFKQIKSSKFINNKFISPEIYIY